MLLAFYWSIHEQFTSHPIVKRYMRRVQVLGYRLFLTEFGIERVAYAGSESRIHKTFLKLWSAPFGWVPKSREYLYSPPENNPGKVGQK